MFLSFCNCFSYDLCLYDQNDCQCVIFVQFGEIWNYRFKVDYYQWSFELGELEFELSCAIVVILGINSRVLMWDDDFDQFKMRGCVHELGVI